MKRKQKYIRKKETKQIQTKKVKRNKIRIHTKPYGSIVIHILIHISIYIFFLKQHLIRIIYETHCSCMKQIWPFCISKFSNLFDLYAHYIHKPCIFRCVVLAYIYMYTYIFIYMYIHTLICARIIIRLRYMYPCTYN